MNKEKVVYTYNGVLFGLKKGNPKICNNMDEPGGHYAKWKMPVSEGQILLDSTIISI